ncbi:piriformospora indica-insensitive protein 2-like [Aristolochia californica]|uniref:piriformospora indica-insensitive protein 2-like n=1 Tax=Aristolochia californica TaxID=171875 RepID=UPI0035DC7916
MSRLIFKSILLLLCFACPTGGAVLDDYLPVQQPLLDQAERKAVYDILTAVNPEVDWSYALTIDLCTAGPHGIVCEIDAEDPSKAHVVELSLGYVSDYSNNPPCSATNASFSPALTRLPYLSKLFVFRCFVAAPTSLPAYIWSLGPQLQELVLQSNPALSGSLPPDFGTISSLRRLIIAGTSISGEIPSAIGKLRSLQQLDFSGNALKSTIPSAIGQLKELVVLDLSRNALVGSIPAGLGPLPKLTKLDLCRNNLSGEIPASMGSLRSLELLDLSDNRLSGGVPLLLGGLGRLKYLHLRGNPFEGTLPNIWSQLQGLVGLDLSRTGLIGPIPVSMGSLKEISYLSLDHNNLSGVIPPALADLPSVNHIDLSHNRFSGQVPFSKVMLRRLGERLRLEGNDELCMDPQTVVSFSEKIGVSVCESSSSSPSVELRVSIDSSAGNRVCGWFGHAGALLSAIIFPILFFN